MHDRYAYDGGYDVRPRAERRLKRVKAPRRVIVRQTEEIYVDVQAPVRVRYVAQPSLAAVQQAERRARNARLHATCGYAHLGYSLGGGCGYGEGYGNVVVVERPVVRKKRHHKRRRMVVPAYTYDQGIVVHYGPAVVKNGTIID
jgi:hypothetical protein